MTDTSSDTIAALKSAEYEASQKLQACETQSNAQLEAARAHAQQILERAEGRIQTMHRTRPQRLHHCLQAIQQEMREVQNKTISDENDLPLISEAIEKLSQELTQSTKN